MAKNAKKFGPKNWSFWRIFGVLESFGVFVGVFGEGWRNRGRLIDMQVAVLV